MSGSRFVFAAAFAAACVLPIASAGAQSLPPTNAKPGQCFAKVLVPAVYDKVPQTVMIRPETSRVTRIPAVYRDVEKRILVEEESHVLEIIPAEYETVSERVMVEPERVETRIVPASFRTETKQVLVSPARSEWKVGRGAHEKVDAATGEIMCLVEIPAVYKSIEVQVVDEPEKADEQVLPARFVEVTRKRMKTPPQTRKKVIPARYETITVKELVTPAREETQTIAAKMATVEQTRLVSEASVQWREILCETNTTAEVVLEIQKQLVARGHSIGTTPNGNYGPATRAAIAEFQKQNGLETGGLTINTLRKLGVNVTNVSG